jgi:hypothetical protein
VTLLGIQIRNVESTRICRSNIGGEETKSIQNDVEESRGKRRMEPNEGKREMSP